MLRELDLVALAVVALGALHILRYRAGRDVRRQRRVALETWETEGGAVPVGPSPTAAPIPPVAHRA
jgi:hypothetical protein